MKVQRTIPMNPVEPHQMSMRVPAKVPLTIDIQYLDLGGNPIHDDLGAQLQVTARTNGQTDTYAAPATDIVNGQARVTIGKDVLTDMNGYRLRLVGTYKGEATLFALGTLRLTEAAGIEETPDDIIDDVPINLAYNFDASISVRLWQDAGKGAPFDLTTAAISAAIYPSSSNPTALVPFTVTPTTVAGEVLLQLTYDLVNTLPAGCWWALRAATAGGLTTLCQGTVTITGIRPPP